MKPAKAALLRYCFALYIQRRSCVCSQFGQDDSCRAENEISFGWAFESRMNILINTRIQMLVVTLAASSALFAQSSGTSPGQPQNQQSMLDARQIVALSVAATERSWQARDYHYTYIERDEDRRLDSRGQVKSEDVDVTRMILVTGVRFEQLIEHNGQPPSAEQERKRREELEKLKRETPEERAARLRKDQENRSFLKEVLQAFDFQLIGEELVEGRPAYVLLATPHPGYHAHGKFGKMFSKGLFVAHMQRGSHIILEQTCVGDSVWVPKRLQIRFSAKILLLKSLNIDRIFTFSDYRPEAHSPSSVCR